VTIWRGEETLGKERDEQQEGGREVSGPYLLSPSNSAGWIDEEGGQLKRSSKMGGKP